VQEHPDYRVVPKREIVLPTLPSFPALAGGESRQMLLTGLTFIEAATSGWTRRDLLLWLSSSAPLFGWPGTPASVTEGAVGTIALHPGVRVMADRVARLEDLPKLLAMARWKCVVTLRALISNDDRFLKGAIFKGRVRRDAKSPSWLARPCESDLLSDVVLSLFAADILTYREFHDANLCVCEVCGRISFNPGGTSRRGCAEHLPGAEEQSGVHERSTLETLPPPEPRRPKC
jgi:hypothetical protein